MKGTITLRGSPFRPANPREAERAGIAPVFQELSLIPDLTVAENIWFRRERLTRLGTVAARDLRERARALLSSLGLSAIDADRPVRHLSVAERQLVEIAKALSGNPAILILDEATSALPPREVDWLLGLARRRAEAGGLVLYISHRMAEVRRVADRITVLRNGETVGTRPTAEVSDDEIVTMMLGRRLDRLYPERRATATQRIALRVQQLEVGHRLRGADLSLREGEVLGVAGLQGHGQRELFLALFGAIRAQGSIEVWGRKMAIRNPHHALSAGVGHGAAARGSAPARPAAGQERARESGAADPAASGAPLLPQSARGGGAGRGRHPEIADQGRHPGAAGRHAVGRQPAEGGGGQAAADHGEDPALLRSELGAWTWARRPRSSG